MIFNTLLWNWRVKLDYWVRYLTKSKPSGLNIEPTNYCNYDCVMCWIKYMKRMGEFMPLNLFKKAVDQAMGLGIKKINLSYAGEPLLHKDIIKMVKYVKAGGIYCYLTTNGSLLTEELSKALIKSGIDEIQVSFHALTPETYKSITKGDKFYEVLENVKTFARLRNGKLPKLTCNYYRMDLNANEYNLKNHAGIMLLFVDESEMYTIDSCLFLINGLYPYFISSF